MTEILRAALTLLADKCGDKREKAEQCQCHQAEKGRGAKTPLLQALEEVFHNSLLLKSTDKHPLIGVIFCGFRYSLDHLAKYIEAKFSAKGLHIKMTANYFTVK